MAAQIGWSLSADKRGCHLVRRPPYRILRSAAGRRRRCGPTHVGSGIGGGGTIPEREDAPSRL